MKSNILSIVQQRDFLKRDVVQIMAKILERHIPIITTLSLLMFVTVYVKSSTCLLWISAADGFLISMRIKTWKLVYLPNQNGANMQRRSYQAFASNLYEITSIPYQGSNLTIVDSPLKKNISKGI